MGQKYESKKKSVSENRESMETNTNEQSTLREEYSILSSLDGLISDLEDETVESIGRVEDVGKLEENRIEEEKEDIIEEREEIVGEIEDELEKLQSSLRKMEQLDKFEFGSIANAGAKNEYKKLIDKYSELISELAENDNNYSKGIDAGGSRLIDIQHGSEKQNSAYENSQIQLLIEDDTGVIRDLLAQNVNNQKLPSSDRVEWLGDGTPGETACRVRDDVLIKVHDKSTNTDVIYSGSEFKEHMLEKYGTDIVNYSHREPDFEPFEQVFSCDSVNEFMEKKYGDTKRNIVNSSAGNVYLEHMDTERNSTFEKANQEIATRLGISKTDVAEYMKEKNLTWHECGDRHTIRAVPSEINQVFGHTGGIGLQQDLQALSESTRRTVGDRISLQREAISGKTEGLESAINSKHKQNREIKKELFGKK